MSRPPISKAELNAIWKVLERRWRPARPEEEIRRELGWFPDPALIQWFLRGDGCGSGRGLTEALSLDEALEWRRELLKRSLPPRERFLPLVRCRSGFVIYDGTARGVALRQTTEPERYVQALRSPLPLRALLPPAPIADPRHFERVLGPMKTSSLEQLSALCDAPELREWFSRVGPTSRQLQPGLRAFCFSDALISRDQLEGAARPALQAQLHQLSWMPLLELPGRHTAVFWKNGVGLHGYRDDRWHEASWARTMSFERFLAALSAWVDPPLPQREDPAVISSELRLLVGHENRRDIDASRLRHLSAPMGQALRTWFTRTEDCFTDAGERLVSLNALERGQTIVPLLRGADEWETCAVEGRGIVLRCGEATLPWAPSLTDWVRHIPSADQRS